MPNGIKMLNGYRLVHCPTHSRAIRASGYNGYVYEHIEVIEKYLGRALRKDEVVHHLDGNRANNRHENLLVLTKDQHMKYHQWLSAVKIERLDGIGAKSVKAGQLYCSYCGRTLQDKQVNACCSAHWNIVKRKARRPTLVELREHLSRMSIEAIGRSYGVCGNAVRKWCDQYGLVCRRRAKRKLSVETIHPGPAVATQGQDIVQGAVKAAQT